MYWTSVYFFLDFIFWVHNRS